MLMEDSSRTSEIIYSAVNSAENSLSISRMCEIAGVSRSGYYAWRKAEPVREKQELQDRKDFELILAAYRQRGYSKGARGIYMSLLHMNPPVVMNLKKSAVSWQNIIFPARFGKPIRTDVWQKLLKPAMWQIIFFKDNLKILALELYCLQMLHTAEMMYPYEERHTQGVQVFI